MRSPEKQEEFLEHGRFGEDTHGKLRAATHPLVWIGLLFLATGGSLFGGIIAMNIGRDDGGPLYLMGSIAATGLGVVFFIGGLLVMRRRRLRLVQEGSTDGPPTA